LFKPCVNAMLYIGISAGVTKADTEFKNIALQDCPPSANKVNLAGV